MSHDYNKDFAHLHKIYFDLKEAGPDVETSATHVQYESLRSMPEVPLGIELSSLNVLLTRNTSMIVTDREEKENLVVGPAGPDPERQTFCRFPDFNTQEHEPFFIFLDAPGKDVKVAIMWKHMSQKLSVSSIIIQ